MAITKLSAFPAGAVPVAADTLGMVQSGVTNKVTASQLRTFVGAGLNNAALAAVAGGYAADTYLAGSSITIPTAGAWVAGSFYSCLFDMTKTAAGTAAFTVTVRMGTLGTTGDAAINTLTLAAGTAAIDNGWLEVLVAFRSVGAATSAVTVGSLKLSHALAATGLASTGASGIAIATTVSAGFNSTTQTIIGLSVNGGASFSGTTQFVTATLDKYQ